MKSQRITDDYCLKSLGHLINANRLWLERVKKGSSVIPRNPTMQLDECERLSAAFNSEILEFIGDQEPDHLYSNCRYQNTKNITFEDSYLDILTHMLNHGEHHRAQIVARMRNIGAIPPATDYLLYVHRD